MMRSRAWRPFMTALATLSVTLAAVALPTAATSRVNAAPPPVVSLQVGATPPTVTVVANHGFFVNGAGFAANETVKVSAGFKLYNTNTITVSITRQTNSAGKFYQAFIRIPRATQMAINPITATGQRSGRRARANLNVTYRPYVNLASQTVLPGDRLFIGGGDFVANTNIRVWITIPRTDASSLTLAKTVTADGLGAFRTFIDLPVDTSSGTYTVTALDTVGGFRATVNVTVTEAEQPGPTPAPPAPQGKGGVGFHFVSLWYHIVRVGTWDHLVISGSPSTQLGIWVTVIFPSGKHYYYFQNTDSSGQWQKTFGVPRDAVSRYSNQAHVTIQLWHGKQTVRYFVSFAVVH